MEKLMKNKPLVIIAVVLILALCGLVIAWQSALYTLNHLSFKDVSPTQMAAAMRQDQFWSSNRFNVLVFNGKVKSVSTVNNQTSLEFATTDSYSATCELSNSSNTFKIGKTYKFAAMPYQAERQPSGVLLRECLYLDN